MKSSGKPIEILTKLNEMAGFDPDEELDLFEVCFSKNLFLNSIYYYQVSVLDL